MKARLFNNWACFTEGNNNMTTKEFNFFKKGYLLLKRRAGQGFHIDDNTEIVIAKVENGEVYVAVKAPDKRIVRNEIMKNEPRSATTIST